jgi:hypothetical protein
MHKMAFAWAIAGSACDAAQTPATAHEQAPQPGATAPLAAAPAKLAPPPKPPAESPTSAENYVGKHVLVAASAPLRVGVGPDAYAVRRVLPSDGTSGARAFEVVGHRDGLLEVIPATAEHRCDVGLEALELAQPRFFVALVELQPVLARQTVVHHEDGTSITLRPGLPVEQPGNAGLVVASGAQLHAAIDPLDVATAYVPALAPRPTTATLRLVGAPTLRYGTHTAAADATWFGDARGPLAISRQADGDDALVEVVHGCATVRARVPGSAVGESGGSIIGPPSPPSRAAGSLLAEAVYFISAGAALSWPDGTTAGRSAVALELVASATRAKKGRRCFTRGERDEAVAPFELCVASKDATKLDPLGMSTSTIAALLDASAGLGGAGSLGALDTPMGVGGLIGADAGLGGGGGLGDGGGLSGLGGLGSRGGGAGATGLGSLGGLGSGGGIGTTAPAVSLAQRDLEVEGALEQAEVSRAIIRRAATLKYCAAREEPVPTGTVSASLEVGPDGTVTDVTLRGVEVVHDCVAQTLRRVVLPTASSATTVKVDLVFTAP